MILDRRHQRIMEELRSGGSASVQELARILDVSESTIRRDLQALDRDGELTRTYGGAVVRPRATVRGSASESDEELPWRAAPVSEIKRRMAAAAAALVSDGSVVILDMGTTTPLIAQHLRGRSVTVITSNMMAVDELREDTDVRLVVLGGVLRRNYQSLVGSLTESMLEQVSADLAIISCTGVRPDGAVIDNMALEAPIKRSMMQAGSRVMLLAPDNKFPGTGAIRFCSLADVDILVTTPGAPAATTELCSAQGGQVVIA